MSTRDVYDRYKELTECDKFICSETELNEFVMCGLVLDLGSKYILRDGKSDKITVIKNPNYRLNLDFSSLINVNLKGYDTNKIYYMSKNTYNKYKNQNLIIEKKGNEYYRLFADELWLVKIL